MKKMRKIFAMLLALTMVLGMTMTASAATVTVNNVAAGKYVQVIVADPTNETGWAFTDADTDDVTAGDQAGPITLAYQSAFNTTENNEIINALIAHQAGSAPCADTIGVALSNVKNASGITWTDITGGSFAATEAGVYAVIGEETGYTYNTMSAYVGFGEVTDANYPTLQDATVNAKKQEITIEKEDNDANDVVAIGDLVTYTITTAFPYIDPNTTEVDVVSGDPFFKISDTIIGADYYFGDDVAAIDGKTKVATVELGDEDITDDVEFVKNGNKTGFTVDLSAYIYDDNRNATKDVTITYTAIVNGTYATDSTANDTKVKNTVDATHSGLPSYGESTVKLYSGEILLTKYAFESENDADPTDNRPLAEAKFKVYRSEMVAGNETKTWATFDTDYKFTGWAANEDGATVVETGSDGTLKVQGLDLGTYKFKEVEAPEGYSLNTTDAVAELVLNGTVATSIIQDLDAFMIDTQLSALPSTGGIGTTIFTVAGCGLMIAAAFFFFVNRKKEA